MRSHEDRPGAPDCATPDRVSREAFDALLDAVRQPLLVLDDALCIVAASRELLDVFGLDAAAIVGEHLTQAAGGRWDLPELHALVADVAAGHRQIGGDYELEGGASPARFHAHRLGDSGRVLLSIEPGVPDVAAPGHGDDRARERDDDRGLDDFLSILGHELRSPLSAIHNVSRLLSTKRADDPERVAELHRILARQTRLMVRLVDDLMDFSRINSGVLSLRRENVSLRECVVAAVNSVELKADNAALDLSVDLPAEDLRVHADPVRITQVVSNLLDNAIKYGVSGGAVWLSIRREGDEAVMRVRDDGIGIDPAALDGIFQVFTRLEHRTRGQEGLGLGLALVRQFVKLHGGDVEAHSDGPGRGAEFVVRLPMAGPPDPSPGDGDGGTDARGARRILVVDDNADSVDTLGGLLEEAGHEVRTAYNGADALGIVAGFEPDVIFLDIGMPDMDGLEVARRLQQDGHLDGVRLVALTGYGQARDLEAFRSAGFDRHLLKPVRFAELESAIYGDD